MLLLLPTHRHPLPYSVVADDAAYFTFYILGSCWDSEIVHVVRPPEPIPFGSMRTFYFYCYCPGDSLNTDIVAMVEAAVVVVGAAAAGADAPAVAAAVVMAVDDGAAGGAADGIDVVDVVAAAGIPE